MGKLVVATIVSLWVIPISIITNQIVPQPYMDEIFHVPQAQQYCHGNFRAWDPMITTPPGLYFLSLAYIGSLFPGMFFSKLGSKFVDSCSVMILRSTNGVLAVICSVVVYEIITRLRPALDDRKATFYSVVLALYPLHWFFTFLYYTDVASLTIVLAMYLACLKKNYWFAALLGGLGVTIRQTNIIWMIFVASAEVINIALGYQRDEIVLSDDSCSMISENGRRGPENSIVSGSNMRKRTVSSRVDASVDLKPSGRDSSKSSMPGLIDEIVAVCRTIFLMKKKLFISFAPFILVSISFAAFVFWNGSVVLGAKEAHEVSPHLVQIMYFGLFSAVLMFPTCFSFESALTLLCSLRKNRPISILIVLLGFMASIVSVHYFSIAHPYLLADNRHYTFYLWRRVINAHWSSKYLLVPLYLYSWLSICTRLGKVQKKKLWVLGYFVSTALVLVPAPLIEFRYYTIPFFLLILHSHDGDIRSWIFMGSLYLALNVFTMIMFLYRPFRWDHEPGTQRFIW